MRPTDLKNLLGCIHVNNLDMQAEEVLHFRGSSDLDTMSKISGDKNLDTRLLKMLQLAWRDDHVQ
jgi:hypothetical protein